MARAAKICPQDNMSNTTQTRYNWAEIPEGYDWAATDLSGLIYAYDFEPKKGQEWWYSSLITNKVKYIKDTGMCKTWAESLECRPQTQTT